MAHLNDFFALNRLSAYVDGQLSERDTAEMDETLLANPHLRRAHAEMLLAIDRLGACGVEAPAELKEELADHLESLERPGRLPIGLTVGVVGAAIVAVVATLVSGGGPGDVAPREPVEVVTQVVEPPAVAPIEALEEEEAPAQEALEEELATPHQVTESSEVSAPAVAPEPAAQAVDPTPIPAAAANALEATPGWESEWLEAGDAPEGEEAEWPGRLRIYPGNSDILWSLESLAEALGVTLISGRGGELVPFSMSTERNYASLKLWAPTAGVEGLLAALNDLGTVTVLPGSATPVAEGDAVEISLEVQFNP